MSNEVKDTGMVLKIGHLYPTLIHAEAWLGETFLGRIGNTYE